MDAIDLMGLDITLTKLLAPWIGLIGTIIIIFLVKDIIYSLIKGLKFRLRPGFESGDNCYIDGKEATIVKIGLLETIFEIDNGRGKVWRYVPNDILDETVLERIIVRKKD
mgnify:FL=1|jgi:hypothetical protein